MSSLPNASEDSDATGRAGDLPASGRVVEGRRKVRMADVGPDRRARLDALARYLGDVAGDDAEGVALPLTVGWVLRSTRLDIDRFPMLGEELVLQTFCSATASRWAERTTQVHGSAGAQFRAVSIWVAVDTRTGSPARLGDWFLAVYGPSAAGRRASAKLTLGAPSDPVTRSGRPWPLRRSDLDAWAHVNNAIGWAAVEDAVDISPADSVVALIEHHSPIDAEMEPVLSADQAGDKWSVWLLDSRPPRRVLVASLLDIRQGAASGTTG